MRSHRPASGFVLIAVLAVLVILSILGASVGAITQRLRDQQLERQRQLRAEIDMASTRATLLYLLTSQRMTFGGLTVDDRILLSEDERLDQQNGDSVLSFTATGNEVALEGSAYEGLGQSRFALQDDRGLLAVNWSPQRLLERYLGLGPTSPRPMVSLMNLMQDYQDSDDLYRLNSEERQGYLRAGRTPPSNRALISPLELRRIIGWDQALAERSDLDLVDSFTVVRSARLNVNTAPIAVLRSLPGMDQALAERVVAARSIQPFDSPTAFYTLVGTRPVDADLLSLYPLGSGTLKLWSADGSTVQFMHWTLTPRADGGRPWREDYEFNLPGDEQSAATLARPVAAKVFSQPDAPSQ